MYMYVYNFQKSQPAVIYIVEGHEKARGFERKHSIYFQDGHRKCRNGIPEFKKGTAFLPSTFSGKVTNSANTEKHRETQDSRKSLQGKNDGSLMYGARHRTSYSSGRRPCRHRTHWAQWAIGDTGFLCDEIIWLSLLLKPYPSNQPLFI